MPEHSSFLTLLLAHIKETLDHNAPGVLGTSFAGNEPGWQSFEPLAGSLLVILIVLAVAWRVRTRMLKTDEAVIPEEDLTLRTFAEAFLAYFYDMAKSVMDADRAKKYFPLIGTAAVFVFCSNIMALIPGMPIATSNLNVTAGCALVVFILFNAYGLATNGWKYLAHLAGPVWYLWPLMFVIELISLFVRPMTLAIRLMVNMTADHMMLGLFLALIGLLVPVPVMLLGVIVVVVQTLVFTLLTCIYVGLATEHETH